jgi:macrolide transport system ATP-binding/permease protein
MARTSAPSPSLQAAADQLRIEGVSRSHAARRVLTDVSFTVGPAAPVGLIGENGSGKSTLLRVAAGHLEPDAGTVVRPVRMGLLEQEPAFPPSHTVAAVLDAALAEAAEAEREVERASTAVAAGAPDARVRLAAALADAERLEVWTVSARRGEVIAGLGLAALPSDRAVRELSGGQRSRLALAALLLARPTALLLDEPTNHLDDEAVDYLAEVLGRWSGPVLFASHDRAFLDRVATRIVDLDPAPLPHAAVLTGDDGGAGYGVRSSRGNYSEHLRQRRAERERWEQRFATEQEELAALRHEAAVTARTTNAKSTPRTEGRGAKKFYADRDAKVTARRVRNATVRIAVLEREQVRKPPAVLAFAGIPAAPRSGADGPLLSTSAVSVRGRLEPTDVAVSTGAKLLVTGGNGAGKSTLLAVLAGELLPSTGVVHRAAAVRTELLRQDVVFPEPERSPRRIYQQALGEERSASVPLTSLGLLPPRDLDRPIGALSVGQQRRLALALVIAAPPHVLLLDEPTNHLSLALAEDLEAALDRHAGAVLVASHDRWLRDRWDHEVLPLAPTG